MNQEKINNLTDKSIAITGTEDELKELIEIFNSKGMKCLYKDKERIGAIVIYDQNYSVYYSNSPIADITLSYLQYKKQYNEIQIN